MLGFNNDIAVFEASTLSEMISKGTCPLNVEYLVNRIKHKDNYLLSDGIYSKALLFVQIIASTNEEQNN